MLTCCELPALRTQLSLLPPEVMGVYFGRIEQLAGNEALDQRHRFMLLDLIEQRRNRGRLRKEVGRRG